MHHEVLLFSDLHLHTWSFGAFPDRLGCNSRLSDGLDVIDRIYSAAASRSISHIIFTGDLFHTRNTVPSEVLQRTFDVFRDNSLKYPDIEVFLMLGNHDWTRDMRFSSVQAFASIPHLEVINTSKSLSLFGGEVQALFIPFTPHHNVFKDAINRAGSVDVVFAHQGFSGLSQDPRNYYVDEIASLPNISSWLKSPKIDLISGHFHDHSIISQAPNGFFGFFVGAALQQNFGDGGCERGFVTYKLGSRKLVFNSLNSFYPRFVSVTESTEVSADLVSGNFVRIQTTDKLMSSLEDYVNSFSPRAVVRKYSSVQDPVVLSSRSLNRSPLEAIRHYVREKAGDLNPGELMDFYEENV